MNSTLIKALVALVPTGILFAGAIRGMLKNRRIAFVPQLVAVVLKHLPEVVQLRPSFMARRARQPIFARKSRNGLSRLAQHNQKKKSRRKALAVRGAHPYTLQAVWLYNCSNNVPWFGHGVVSIYARIQRIDMCFE